MFPMISKVRFFNEVTEEMEEENRLFYANDLVDAAEIIKDYYGYTIEKVSFEFFEEGWLFKVSDEAIEEIRKELI